MAEFSGLEMISPVDGRYHHVTQPLKAFFSESALIRYRIHVEVEYFIALCESGLPELANVDSSIFGELRECVNNHPDFAEIIKAKEKVTNHDVKAVEYFLRDVFDEMNLSSYKEFIHFGLTSQDINNTSFPLMFKDALNEVFLPVMNEVLTKLNELAMKWKDIPMLARTHGQPASPTRIGKEIMVFFERLSVQMDHLNSFPHTCKFGGATGNFNAHHIAYPDINWIQFSNKFAANYLGIQRQQTTTQIEHYDWFSTHCDGLKRINNILIDLNRDMWAYISMDYFKQTVKKDEVGSSAMPHKVNPIDFENSEGNLSLANALYSFLSSKLPISRLQRDLTDSTVIRNIGVPMAHSLIALKSLLKGLNKIVLNEEKIKFDLDQNWAVVAEAIQTVLRKRNYPDPYSALKALTRGASGINKNSLIEFIDSLDLPPEVKDDLKSITPFNYTGI